MTKRILFLVRSYNDMDCRSPLMAFLARRYDVGVLALPSEKGFFCVQSYEFIDLVVSAGVKLEKSAVFLGWMSRYIKRYFALVGYFSDQPKPLRFLALKSCYAIFNIAAKISLRLRADELERFVEEYDLVIVDEIIFQPGRSVFFSYLTELAESRKIRCLSMLTGQNPYKEFESAFNASWSGRWNDVRLLVPCENDKQCLDASVDAEIRAVGNTRFDRDWVTKVSNFAADGPSSCEDAEAMPSGPKVAVMCSKFEGYGIDEERFFQAIRRLALIYGCFIKVKPHTRGMAIKPEHFNNEENVEISLETSTKLIDWADVVLFTGSSIAIQAMLMEKTVIFASYLQSYRTIYDDYKIPRAEDVDELVAMVSDYARVERDYSKFLSVEVRPEVVCDLVCKEIDSVLNEID